MSPQFIRASSWVCASSPEGISEDRALKGHRTPAAAMDGRRPSAVSEALGGEAPVPSGFAISVGRPFTPHKLPSWGLLAAGRRLHWPRFLSILCALLWNCFGPEILSGGAPSATHFPAEPGKLPPQSVDDWLLWSGTRSGRGHGFLVRPLAAPPGDSFACMCVCSGVAGAPGTPAAARCWWMWLPQLRFPARRRTKRPMSWRSCAAA